MKSKMKRLLAVLLSVMLVFSVVPTAAWAEEPVDTQADADTAQEYWITSDFGIVRPSAGSKENAYAGAGETTVYFQPYSHYALPEGAAVTADYGVVKGWVPNGNGYNVTLANVTADTKLTITGYTPLPTYQVSLPKEYAGYNIAVDVGTYQLKYDKESGESYYTVKVGQNFDFEVYFTNGNGEGKAFEVKANETTLTPDTGYSGYVYHASGQENENIQITVDVVAAKRYTNIYASKFVVPADVNWNGSITDAYDEAYQYIDRVEVGKRFTFYIAYFADQIKDKLTVSYGGEELEAGEEVGNQHYYTIQTVQEGVALTVTGLLPHTHSFGVWTEADSTNHQRKCACGEIETEAHDIVNGACKCGYTQPSGGGDIPPYIPSHTHVYDRWASDANAHWRVCACGDAQSLSGSDSNQHNFSGNTCTVCGYTKQTETVTINKSLVVNTENETGAGKTLVVDVPAAQDTVHVTGPAAKEISKSGVDTVINLKQTDDSTVKVTIPVDSDLKTGFDVKVVLTKESIAEAKETGKHLKVNVAIGDEDTTPAPMKITFPITTKTDIEAGKKVYIYVYDQKTDKLVEAPNSKKTVSKAGNVTIPVINNGEYVVSAKKLGDATKLVDTITVNTQKTTVTAGKKVNVAVSLPNTISKVSAFTPNYDPLGTEEAKITYQSSDSKVASVSKNGSVTAKKKGTAVITVTIALENGQTKTGKKKITVK